MNVFINSQQWCQWFWLSYSFLALDTGSQISKTVDSCPGVRKRLKSELELATPGDRKQSLAPLQQYNNFFSIQTEKNQTFARAVEGVAWRRFGSALSTCVQLHAKKGARQSTLPGSSCCSLKGEAISERSQQCAGDLRPFRKRPVQDCLQG